MPLPARSRGAGIAAAVKPLLISLSIALFVRLTILQLFAIPSDSMAPTLRSGDRIAVLPYDSWIAPRLPERGDVAVFRRGRTLLVKRIVAGPGDTVSSADGRLLVNGRPFDVSAAPEAATSALLPTIVKGNHYFVVGDNRPSSLDSRHWGTVERQQILGEVALVLWSKRKGGSDITAAARGDRRSRFFSAVD